MTFNILFALAAILFSSLVTAQLSGDVGPSTTKAAKAATKVCNILNYGGKASKTTDNGPAIASAWAACKSGGEGISSLHVFRHLLTCSSLYPCWGLWPSYMGHSYWRNSSFHKFGWYHLPHRASVDQVLRKTYTDFRVAPLAEI